ncbi:MAG: M13 family metallopeptidase, partial [Saprospiraceae bacterium]
YYNPSYNEIVFPAGILQFPFFDFKADDAVNYGAIGFVIGHELSHGFDDQGSLYDKDGNLNDWWSKEDRKNFTDRTKKIVDLFNSFDVNGQKVNGSLTLGENIADFGGLATAYDAFKMTKQGQSNEKIDGFTPDQRFLLSATQVWRMKARPEFETQMLLTDPHSPAKWRINGPIPHLDVYYTAFNVKEGDKMYVKPEDRIKVW